jgi:hypothetical protein
VSAFVAATDQLRQACNVGFHLRLNARNLHEAFGRVPDPDLRRDLVAWETAPIAVDVRAVRVRATHHHYAKRAAGPRLEVQELPLHSSRVSAYVGSRSLDAYCAAAVEHLREPTALVDAIARSLTSG